MMTSEDRVAKGAMWLEQLRGWQDSGESLVSYARRRGFDAEAAYRWRRILRRSGQWTGAQAERKVVNTAARAAAKFARVALSDGARAASMLLRLSLSNGRRAELELADISQLGEVLRLIERAA